MGKGKKGSKTPNTNKDAEKMEDTYTAGVNIKGYYHYEKVWQFLTRLNMQFHMTQSITFLGTNHREMKSMFT